MTKLKFFITFVVVIAKIVIAKVTVYCHMHMKNVTLKH